MPAQDQEQYQQEVRLAVVVYGGVSLAIYINGVVQEMLKLVRATARTLDSTPRLLLTEPRGSELVYRELGKLLGNPERTPLEMKVLLDAGPEPVRTRFVIDVLSGTSAGGINAVFLAKALANDQPLTSLQNTWIGEGDIQKLLNDRGTDRLPRNRPPRSLLNGPRMYEKLLQALDDMEEAPADGPRRANTAGSPLVESLDLFCTATDLDGFEVHLPLTERDATERKFKAVFHFRHTPGLPKLGALPSTLRLNDFRLEENPFLAFAARCTSSFPFAFEPMSLADIYPSLLAADKHRGQAYAGGGTDAWQRFYVPYPSQAFERRAFADGGYLDNKPFSYAVDTILTRDAELPVIRKLIYIEPNPEPGRGNAPQGKPDAVANVLLAATTLPRYEGIREDLEFVLRRNQQLQRVQRVLAALETDAPGIPQAGGDPSSWLGARVNNPCYEAYERLKVSSVTDDLFEPLAQYFGISLIAREGVALRLVAGRWRKLNYPDMHAERQFLLDFDISYRSRRLRDVSQFIDQLHRKPAEAVEDRDAYRAELRRLRQGLRQARGQLQVVHQRTLRSATTELTDALRGELAWVLDAKAPTPALLVGDGGAPLERAERVAKRGSWSSQIDTLAAFVKAPYRVAFDAVAQHVLQTLADDSVASDAARAARTAVRQRYDAFEALDARKFPITFGIELAEGRPIDIHRISPADAVTRHASLPATSELKGTQLGNFGAFLDETWRQNDILLGRLDGAERLIRILLHGTDAQDSSLQQSLIERAHQAITTEFLDSIGFDVMPSWQARLQRFCTQHVRAKPEAPLVGASAARGTTITGEMLDEIAKRRDWPHKPFAGLALLGRAAWGIVEVSMPRSVGQLFSTYFLKLLGLVGLLLWVLAAVLRVFGVHGQTGVIVGLGAGFLAASLLLHVGRDALTRFLSAERPLVSGVSRVLVMAALVVGACVLLGGGEKASAALSRLPAAASRFPLGLPSLEQLRFWAIVFSALLAVGFMATHLGLMRAYGVLKPSFGGQLIFSPTRLALLQTSLGDKGLSQLRRALWVESWWVSAYALLFALDGVLTWSSGSGAWLTSGAAELVFACGAGGFGLVQLGALSRLLRLGPATLDRRGDELTDQAQRRAIAKRVLRSFACGVAKWVLAFFALHAALR